MRRFFLNPIFLASILGLFTGLEVTHEILSSTTTSLCNSAQTPVVILAIATWVKICRPEAKALIPALLTSPELGALSTASLKFPDTKEMFKDRIEIGKITAALASIGTTESQQTISAIERYDDQARKTIRALTKVSAASELTHKTVTGILTGIIQALSNFPSGEKRAYVLRATTQSRQAQIDAWIAGLQDQLRQLLLQCNDALSHLDSCDLHLRQIIQTSGRTQGGQEKIVKEADGGEGVQTWIKSLFGQEDIRPAALKAISNLEALINASGVAREVVEDLSKDLARAMVEIEAAYRYPDRMLTVEMTLEEEVVVMVDMLRRLQREAETNRVSNGSR